jgi:hypothetical protein
MVYMADREADIMALMVRARNLNNPVDWLIRSKSNRTMPEGDKLWEQTCGEESLGELRFTMPGRPGHKAREVVQTVWAKSVELKDGTKDGRVKATCIVAREVSPPVGEPPIEWRLLTNLAATDLAQASGFIDWYRARWEIEMFFHVLKNGCRVEALQLGSIEKIERAFVVYMIVAWRIAHLMRLGRTCPELNAQLMFEPDEWKAAYVLNKLPIPPEVPTLNEVVRLVARLGGFLARKGDGEPGVKTIWLGMQRIIDFAAGIRFYRELQVEGSCV